MRGEKENCPVKSLELGSNILRPPQLHVSSDETMSRLKYGKKIFSEHLERALEIFPTCSGRRCIHRLTMMTDTPAVVLFCFGVVLKCVFSLPETSVFMLVFLTASCCVQQRETPPCFRLSLSLHAERLECFLWEYRDPGVREDVLCCTSSLSIHLQHPADQILDRNQSGSLAPIYISGFLNQLFTNVA